VHHGLALQRQRADDAQLAETVYRFDHDSGRIEQQANALLEAADEADKERRRQERASLDQRIVERVTALGGDEKAAARELGLSLARVRGALRRLGAARPPG
jgi:transcriptional regulator with GAF, ATPase, and Fis domain